MKTCTKCGEDKPKTEFYADARKSDGLFTHCKACHSNITKSYKENNKQKEKEWRKSYDLSMKEHRSAKAKERYKEKKQLILETNKKWRDSNKEKMQAIRDAYFLANKDKINKSGANWKRNNKEKVLSMYAKRRASLIERMPKWIDESHKKDIESFYESASAFKIYTGQTYHVDHIVPLLGKTVSGLHVPWNLQVLPEIENLKKSNKQWPDSW
jgi:hypothetical protein